MAKMEKKEFVRFIGMMLSFAAEDIAGCHINDENDNEVIIVFENGYVKKANIEGNSRKAIIKDIIAEIER